MQSSGSNCGKVRFNRSLITNIALDDAILALDKMSPIMNNTKNICQQVGDISRLCDIM